MKLIIGDLLSRAQRMTTEAARLQLGILGLLALLYHFDIQLTGVKRLHLAIGPSKKLV